MNIYIIVIRYKPNSSRLHRDSYGTYDNQTPFPSPLDSSSRQVRDKLRWNDIKLFWIPASAGMAIKTLFSLESVTTPIWSE